MTLLLTLLRLALLTPIMLLLGTAPASPVRWLLLRSIRVRGADPDDILAVCSECGRSLYAAVFYIARTGQPERPVGSGCCKRLTGHTPAQLADNETKRRQALAAIEDERLFQISKREWTEANADVLAFLRQQAAAADADYEAQCTDYDAGNRERYPHLNDFWQSLLDYAEQRGTLSEKQMAVVNRIMKRDISKALPEASKRITVSGTVIASKCKVDDYRSGYGRLAYLAQIDIDNGGLHYRITARDNSKLFSALGLAIDWDGKLSGVPDHISVIGMVKWAKDGLVILNRSKLA